MSRVSLERFARAFLGRSLPPPIYPMELPTLTVAPSQFEADAASLAQIQVVHERDNDLRDDWTDTNRPLKPREKPIHFRPLRPAVELNKAVDHFIRWANDAALTGLFTAAEIDELWRRANNELGFAEIQPIFVRGALSERNLRVGKRRTMTPEYAAVRQRTGTQRGTLYRLPVVNVQVGQEPVQVPGEPDLLPGSGRHEDGLHVVSSKKTRETQDISYADAA